MTRWVFCTEISRKEVKKIEVILATGIEELDKEIARTGQGAMSFKFCYYREGIQVLLKKNKAAVIVVSPCLPGTTEVIELIRQIRVGGRRVVLLPGPKTDENAMLLARKAVGLGVYDIVWDPVRPSLVIQRINNPATLGDAGIEPDGEPAENVFLSGKKGRKGIRRTGIFGRLFKRKKQDSTAPDFEDTAVFVPPDTVVKPGTLDQTVILKPQTAPGAAITPGTQEIQEVQKVHSTPGKQSTPEIQDTQDTQKPQDTQETQETLKPQNTRRTPEIQSTPGTHEIQNIQDTQSNSDTQMIPGTQSIQGKAEVQSVLGVHSVSAEPSIHGVQGTPETPQVYSTQNKADTTNKPGLSGLFSKLITRGKQNGVIIDGDFIEGDWSSTQQVRACDAVVIPASWGIKAVREFRRDPRFRAVPLIVVKGRREHLQAGADMCVRRINPKVIEEAEFLSRRYREFWEKAEFDSLTGIYKKDFLLEWISEQERRPEPCFSVAMIDIDHFKAFNDTYGHQAGDAVLAQFGSFLKAQTRATDVAARYGGEEFVIGLPNTPGGGAQVLIDRLRESWSRREITLPSGDRVGCTFSAGVAEYRQGTDIIAEADRFLYRAKNEGRNRVKGAGSRKKVLLLGQGVSGLVSAVLEQGMEIAPDPAEADIVISDLQSFAYAPQKPLCVLGTGTISDFAVKVARPDARVFGDPDELLAALTAPAEAPHRGGLRILPGGHSDKGHTLARNSALYVVCPSRPGMAGEVAASLAKAVENCALVCAAPESTGALALGIPKDNLICSDWRIPGSDAPLEWGGVTVWPVDPFKFLNVKDVSAHALVEQIKPKFNLVVVDCAGNLEIASRAPKTDGVIVLHKEGDTADAATSYWLKNYAGSNVFVMSPSEIPDVLEAEDGFVVAKRGASFSRINN